MIRTVYRKNLEPDFIKNKKGLLSFSLDVKDDESPIIDVTWEFIWHLIKYKFKGKLYFLVKSNLSHESVYYNFFTIKK